MSDQELGETQPLPPSSGPTSDNLEVTQPHQATAKTQPLSPPSSEDTQEIVKRPRRWRRVLGAILGLLLFVALGGAAGYGSGIGARQQEAKLQRAVEAFYQFGLGESDLQAGNCDIARQRFSYVIELDPSYPGAPERLAESLLCAGTGTDSGAAQPTATVAPIEATPTPDLRAAEEIYAQAQSLLAAENWDELLTTIDTLRANYPDFEPIQGDGMYYIALRNRGVDRILVSGELEPGIYDLNRAEQIGPLDADAENYRRWASDYIVAQSFWEVDWAQAVQYFSQVAAEAPSLHDVDFFSAQDRLAEAQVHYAQQLVDRALFLSGAKGWCEAEQLMDQANSYSPHSPEVQPTATWISDKCALNPDSEANIP